MVGVLGGGSSQPFRKRMLKNPNDTRTPVNIQLLFKRVDIMKSGHHWISEIQVFKGR